MSEQTANLCTTDAAESLREIVERQAREIERLRLNIAEYNEHERCYQSEIAALKAQPSGVLLPELRTVVTDAFMGMIAAVTSTTPPADQPPPPFIQSAIDRAVDRIGRINSSHVSAGDDAQYPPCDYCAEPLSYHPWHGSGLINGVESRHIHACDKCRHLLPTVSAGEYGDAYQGAREDLAIWKRRALEAEAKIREQDQIIENMGNALNDENGPTFMGEPVIATGVVDERAAFEAWYLGHFYMGDKQCGLEWLSTEPCGGYRHQHPAEQWIVWQARAALSAPSHGEQVREAVLEELLTRCADWCDKQPKQPWYGRKAGDMVRTFMVCQPLAAAPSAGSQEQGE